MSYCRWSSQDWKCDLYCYSDVSGGYTTHVAGNRVIDEVPSDRFADFMAEKITAEEYVELHKQQLAVVQTSQRIDIELPHAGGTFNDTTLEEFRDRLVYLRGLGYVFPDSVFDEVNEELGLTPRVQE